LVEVVPGDGRLSLQKELDRGQRNNFDILVIDAFSSDAIPFHLLTREAYGLFLEHLKPSGLIAAHVSNRHFNLAPILYRIGKSYGLEVMSVNNPEFGLKISGPARWIFLSRDPARIRTLQMLGEERMRELRLDGSKIVFGQLSPTAYMGEPLWTDDFNSLLGVLNLAK
jgi:spermidine synthase